MSWTARSSVSSSSSLLCATTTPRRSRSSTTATARQYGRHPHRETPTTTSFARRRVLLWGSTPYRSKTLVTTTATTLLIATKHANMNAIRSIRSNLSTASAASVVPRSPTTPTTVWSGSRNSNSQNTNTSEAAWATAVAALTSCAMILAFPSSTTTAAAAAAPPPTTTAASLGASTTNNSNIVVMSHLDPGCDEDDTRDKGKTRGYANGDCKGQQQYQQQSHGYVATMALAASSSAYTHPYGGQAFQRQHAASSLPVAAAASAEITRDTRNNRDRPYDVSVRALKGGRVTMEDEYFVAEGGRFVAVFDGHGGGGVSHFLKHHLYDAVCQNLRKTSLAAVDKTTTTQEQLQQQQQQISYANTSTAPSILCSNRTTRNDNNENDYTDQQLMQLKLHRDVTPSVFSHAAALKAAFATMEEAVMADDALSYQGSTAVAVCLHEGPHGHRTLLSANVGDSRAVLSRNGQAVDLTRDHKPNEEREKARILAMGEVIEWDRLSKVHRVRNLSLSRAIGDRFAKPVVSGEVEINHFPVVDDGDEFVILASDGLWDAMTSEEAVMFVHQTIQNELSRENIAKDDTENFKLVLRRNMAKFVAREAIRRGSCDNVCVIMVWLNDMRPDDSKI